MQRPSRVSRSKLDDVRAILREARGRAYAAVNTAMVQAYWQIGRRIVEEEQGGERRAGYGDALITGLARALGDEFGKGMSVANLWNFKKFYLAFPDEKILYTLCRELSWSHWRLIMRVESPDARGYYMEEAARQQWSVRTLDRAITTHSYQRLLKAPDAAAAAPEAVSPLHFLKDPYILEFLDLPEGGETGERDLENALTGRLRDFLMELGKGFFFVGRQFRVSTETSHFYVDLVFYNYLLKCFVLIDLKTQKLTHGDIGQMDMYVRMFDDLKRGEDDNPTLGIILCADKDDTLVHYSVLRESEQLFASKYRLILPSEEELKAELDRRHILDWPERPEPTPHPAAAATRSEARNTGRTPIIGVEGRKTEDGVLLADPKAMFEDSAQAPKIHALHPCYGRAMIVFKTGQFGWHPVVWDEASQKAKLGPELDWQKAPVW